MIFMQKGQFFKTMGRCLFAAVIVSIFLYSTPFQQDISEYEKRLTKIAQDIENLKARIRQEEKKKNSVLSKLDRIGFEKKLIRNEISMCNLQIKRANTELISIGKRITQLETKLDREKESVAKILVTLYKFGKLNYFGFIFQAKNIGSLLSENKHLTILAHYQERIISSYINTLTELETSKEELESKKKEINQSIQNTQQKRKELDDQEKNNKTLIGEINQNQKTYLKALEELKDRTEQLQLLIRKLLQNQISLPVHFSPLYEKKGKLSWPIIGKTVTLFGLKRHPRFNTITMNNGIEISPQKNIIVRSIHPGTIVYADYFQGYGNLIIIDHGMAYYSLYGHCSDLFVKKGDMVEEKQTIAMVGDISSLKGITLYFEIRFKTKPLNPLQWLKRR